MLKMQPEMSQAIKVKNSYLGNEALQTFRNTHASNERTLEDKIIISPRKHVRPS